MKTSARSLMLFSLLSASVGSAQTQDSGSSPLPSAFRSIITANKSVTAASSSAFAARPAFSQPSLSPQGTRLAMIAREADSVTTLVVLDISATQFKPIMRLELPYLQSIQSYGWASEDRLVVWANVNTQYSSDDNPSSSLYIAQLDLKTKKVTERMQASMMSADVESPYPLSSDLVRAPWRDPNHVLISECKRQGGVKFKQRSLDSQYTFASTQTLSSSTIICQLLDWDLVKNRAASFAKPIYAYPTRFFASRDGNNLTAEGRKLSGKIAHSVWDATKRKWVSALNSNQAEFLPQWDSSELDYPQLWAQIHNSIPDNFDPSGTVLKTSNHGEPVGIQFAAPAQEFVALDASLASAHESVTAALNKTTDFGNAMVKWLAVTDNRNVAILSAETPTNPGTYFLWRRADNTLARVTDTSDIDSKDLIEPVMQTNWLAYDLPVAVIKPAPPRVNEGLVVMPVVVDDDGAADTLRTVDLTAQWFVANGLTVVRVPVGLPGGISTSASGNSWRKQVAQRIELATQRARRQLKLRSDDPTCLYGKDADAYAALAASAFDSGISCVLAINARLEPKIFAQPYTMVTTTQKTWYLSSGNPELKLWRNLFGNDLGAGTPANWNYSADNKIFLGFEMFDEHRVLSTFTNSFTKQVSKAGGSVTLYTANVNSTKPDQWSANLYDAMLRFVLPLDREAKKVGRVYVEDPDSDTKER